MITRQMILNLLVVSIFSLVYLHLALEIFDLAQILSP